MNKEWFRTCYFKIDHHPNAPTPGASGTPPADYGVPGMLNEQDFEYTWDWFEGVREYYQKAAAEGRWSIFTVDQQEQAAGLFGSRGTVAEQVPHPLRLSKPRLRGFGMETCLDNATGWLKQWNAEETSCVAPNGALHFSSAYPPFQHPSTPGGRARMLPEWARLFRAFGPGT